jgi:hypothetical protein
VSYQCARCQVDPQPQHFASPRVCLFTEAGEFSEANWNCATVEELFNVFEESAHFRETIYGNDESMDIVPAFPDGDHEAYGWLVLTRYKRRGRVSGAIWVGDFWPAQLITPELVEKTIAGLRSSNNT